MIAASLYQPLIDNKTSRVAQPWVQYFSQTFPVVAPPNTSGRALTAASTSANPFIYQNVTGFYVQISAYSTTAGIQYQFSRDGVTYTSISGTVPAQAAVNVVLAPKDYFKILTGGAATNYVVIPL
jgi:hypothetical protein